jgi:hypothetical protein
MGVSVRAASGSEEANPVAMNWFRENRWLGTFLIVFGVCTLIALYLLFSARSAFEEASARFNDATLERNRLEHLNPFPNEANFRQLKKHIENYGAALKKLKEELKAQVLPVTPMAPNEFQSHLRQAMTATADKARVNRVKLPENFQLGFDEFTTALPNTAAAPLLGQELAQIEALMNILIDAKVDALTVFKRMPLAEEKGAAATPTPVPGRRPAAAAAATGPKMLERAIVDLTFTSSPSAARKVLNQIATSNQQFCVVRLLHVHNEQEKGPPREQTAGVGGEGNAPNAFGATTAAAGAVPGATPKPTPSAAIKFIVGNEHIDVSARIEIVRFDF